LMHNTDFSINYTKLFGRQKLSFTYHSFLQSFISANVLFKWHNHVRKINITFV